MQKRGRAIDRNGRIWTGVVVRKDEAEDEDFRFWFEELTPDQRVEAVDECLMSSLKAKGLDGPIRLRRVSRVIKRKRR
ncbi:MAG: hypothetical protein AB1696_10450 [Planctomycetota bacterium]